MKVYERMKCRRQALGLTREQLAEKANLKVKEVEFYEVGYNTASYINRNIQGTLWEVAKNLDSINHYKRRILEIALLINNNQDDVDMMLKDIGHMMVELGKLQMDTIEEIMS